ncbi:MAG: hypothetical protein DI535_14500 [Citrobacter freundii]|nr:MAG: hypothetical protein DI535_14500 [Citrobacter freundii]
MEEINDWQAVWKTADTNALPSANEMKAEVRKFLQTRIQKKWMVIVTGFVLAVLVLIVLVITPFKIVTTYIGGGLIALSCLGMSFDNARSLKRFYQCNDHSTTDFLAFIEKTRQNQLRFHKRTQGLILMGLSAGMCLYLYEPALHHPVLTAGIYLVFAVYIAVCWFVIRPRVFIKSAEALNKAKERIEKLEQQLKETENEQA